MLGTWAPIVTYSRGIGSLVSSCVVMIWQLQKGMPGGGTRADNPCVNVPYGQCIRVKHCCCCIAIKHHDQPLSSYCPCPLSEIEHGLHSRVLSKSKDSACSPHFVCASLPSLPVSKSD